MGKSISNNSSQKYVVKVDTREQKPWWFEETKNCGGCAVHTLKYGDYTLDGYEDVLRIERKGSVSELGGNMSQRRFPKLLKNLNEFKYSYLILEFTVEDILSYPENSDLPKEVKEKIQMRGAAIIKKLIEYTLMYPNIRVIFAGNSGKYIAASIFKRILENV